MRFPCNYNNKSDQKKERKKKKNPEPSQSLPSNTTGQQTQFWTGNHRNTTPTHAVLWGKHWSSFSCCKQSKNWLWNRKKEKNSPSKTVHLKCGEKLTRFIIYLCEDVLDGLVVILALRFGVRWCVASLPAPLHHLSGLRGSEGLQAGRAVQHVLDNPLHRHGTLKLHREMPEPVMLNCTGGQTLTSYNNVLWFHCL